MNAIPTVWALGAALLAFGPASAAAEPPSLAAQVQKGELPRQAQRLPARPLVLDFAAVGKEPGRHGGELRLLMAGVRDTRMMTVYGYTRLVRFNESFELVPDILEAVEVVGDRSFTLRLRPGHRWSDGTPFTSEDFRYWWEDVANNKQLSPVGPPSIMIVAGEPPRFEVLSPTAVRFSWSKPNPHFLPELAGPSPLYLYRPAHYLKTMHQKYADKAKLEELVKQAGQRNWAALHNRSDNLYRADNPELPSLDPWINTTKPPSDRFIFVRNPYFHRVDAQGQQLPYIDRVTLSMADSKIIPTKTGAGEADLQARYLRFDNYTFLKEAEKRHKFDTVLWRSARGAHMALFPNLNANDPVWRQLLRDKRFRQALSQGIDRHEINEVVYYGLAIEGANTVLSESPLYKEGYRHAHSKFDVKRANALLDEIGLTKRDGRGVRFLPDGRPLEVIVETAGENTEETDVLALVHDSWMRIGVKLYSRPTQREVFRNRIFAGETLMSIFGGLENGVPTADMSPAPFVPVDQNHLQWPKWGQHVQTAGKSGEAPDTPGGQELMRLHEAWMAAGSRGEREKIWHKILELHAENVWTIGLIAGVPQPVVVSRELRNVPKAGIYNWDPGAHFGLYSPDTFWFATDRQAASLAQ
jgi:peptide/nickel transport system substrate-binding protein